MKYNNIFLYWDNLEEMPEYIDLCKNTIFFHNSSIFDIHLITSSDLTSYIGLPNNFNSLTTPKKSDFIRVALLKQYGGIWLDIDCICLRSLKDILHLILKYDYVGYGNLGTYVSNAFMASRPNSPIINNIYEKIYKKIQNNINLKWNELGSISVTEVCRENKDNIFIHDSRYFAPISYDEREKFFETIEASYISPKSYTSMLFNSTFLNETDIHNMSQQQLLEQNWLISNLLKTNMSSSNL